MTVLRKIPPALVLALGLVSALLSIIGSFSRWYAVAAGGLTAVVVLVQFTAQGNFTVPFTTSDWRKNEDLFQFSAGRNHGKGPHPNVGIYAPSANGGYEQVVCDTRTLESGEVLIEATRPFVGEVRIS